MDFKRWTLLMLDHPKVVIGATLLLTLFFAAQFPKIAVDTDPKHMLPATSPVRQYNDEMEKNFALHPDVIVLRIVNSEGVFNAQTLRTVKEVTLAIQALPGVISRDVDSLTTVDNVSSENGELIVKPALGDIPRSSTEFAALRKSLLGNPLFVGRFISEDATTLAIFVPIESKANGKVIADKIRSLLPKDAEGDKFYIAGDPVARDTFGTEMFRQMALFSPIAGMVMCIALWFMFRSVTVIVANMAVAMISIIWSMGGLIGLGQPVHIMTSMSPVFLMAIATDVIHIFNEFVFRLQEVKDKRKAILETMQTVGPAVFYSDITTAVGFAALATGSIVPVTTFGLVVGFGTVTILLKSYTLVTSIIMLIPEKHILMMVKAREQKTQESFSWLSRLGRFCVEKTKPILVIGLVLMVVATAGLARIRVNNNMVNWFKWGSVIRTSDRVMNEHLGGTSTAYLVIQGQEWA